MIRKTVKRTKLSEQGAGDLAYWLSRPPEERIEAVEILRRQRDGADLRMQKVSRVVQRKLR